MAKDGDPADEGVISITEAAQLLADTSVQIQRRQEQRHRDKVDAAAEVTKKKARDDMRAHRKR